MSLGASIVCIAKGEVASLVAALASDIRYSVVGIGLTDAAEKLAGMRPAAVVIADPDADPALVAAIVRHVEGLEGPYVPVLARLSDTSYGPTVLPIAADAAPFRVVARLTSALRIRALHATVQCRAVAARDQHDDQHDDTLNERQGLAPPCQNDDDPDQVTVLVAGRGGGYPALTMAIGERAGLVGALSFETATRYLEGRDIDGIVIGDGFSGRTVEAFLAALGADVRFRDLPLVIADSHIGALDLEALPNADRMRGGPDRVVDRILPLVRLHAFGARLRRWTRAFDSKGLVDAQTGLLRCDAFIRELTRAAEACEMQKTTLSLARFSFDRIDRHMSLDAARIVGRLVRETDFACQDDDGSIYVVFGETDLRAAHVVARRIASALKYTMLLPDPDAPRLNPEVALVMRKASDTAQTLLARVNPAAIAAE